MSRKLNHGYEDSCSEETFNSIYNMAYARGQNNGFDKGKNELSSEIMECINSGNRGSADYSIVNKIEAICKIYVDIN